MGLDVYLYYCKNRDAAIAAEKEAERLTNELWESSGKKYDEMTEEERDELEVRCNKIRADLGCDDCGQAKSVTGISFPSKQYPAHMFKIGYFRSSYNSGGINSVLRKIGMPDLYDIMGVTNGEYEVRHDWYQCLAKIDLAIDTYQKHLNSPIGKYSVMEIRHPIDRVATPAEALKIFGEQLEQSKKGGMFTNFSSKDGEFYLDGLKVHAFIPSSDRLTQMYVILSKEDSTEEDWYLQALKIMRETCEWVLDQEDPQNYYMHWSG